MATALTDELAPPMERTEAAALAEMLQALGDPTRLRILSILDTACVPVGAIVAATGLRQPTVSHHLRVLRDRGLVRAEGRGAFVYYCAASDAVRPVIDAARALLPRRDRPVIGARLYCQGGCAACEGLARHLSQGGVAVEVHDVRDKPDAFDEVVALGYRSLPVLVGPDGSSAAGADATALAWRLSGIAGSVGRHVHRQTVGEE